ncbi:MAG TPA: hypothetical protein VF570_12095 [Pyrinomonadaceae bacterium]|jgi:hypothetical protein
MDEFFKSAARFYWATALFGARQLGGVLSPGEADGAREAFDSVTRATEGQLGGALKRLFRAGDQAQRGFWDAASGVAAGDALTSRGMMRTTLEAVRQSAGALGQLVQGGDARASLLEFQNKLQVFNLFEHADAVLGLPREAGADLPELVGRTRSLDSFLRVWATEGVGYYYAEVTWEARGAPRGLLTDGAARGVPAHGMAALHAGMGLSLAGRVLGSLAQGGREPGRELQAALGQFVALCRDNSAEGYVGAAYEALGLVTRNLYPHLVTEIDRQLGGAGDHLAEFFWHGVGRAIYFAPTNYVPVGGGARRALEMSQREPPHELGRLNAQAGVAWALLLVNLRHPEVIKSALRQCGEGALRGDAFANGVSSAAVVWRDSTADDPHLGELCRYRPGPDAPPGAAARWRELVELPCRRALDTFYEPLRRRGLLGEVFRYRSLAGLSEES